AVSDGMGGEALGEQASFIAVSGLPEIEKYFVENNGSSFAKLMSRYLDRVNQRLCALIRQNRGIRMGSTFVSALLSHGTLRTLNIGDSR
ncbi:hypothetical protein NL360_27935, partial [Klebsiella pneumoniae]|nr:hypothetical protein [Klebsiella pneumoniae]